MSPAAHTATESCVGAFIAKTSAPGIVLGRIDLAGAGSGTRSRNFIFDLTVLAAWRYSTRSVAPHLCKEPWLLTAPALLRNIRPRLPVVVAHDEPILSVYSISGASNVPDGFVAGYLPAPGGGAPNFGFCCLHAATTCGSICGYFCCGVPAMIGRMQSVIPVPGPKPAFLHASAIWAQAPVGCAIEGLNSPTRRRLPTVSGIAITRISNLFGWNKSGCEARRAKKQTAVTAIACIPFTLYPFLTTL